MIFGYDYGLFRQPSVPIPQISVRISLAPEVLGTEPRAFPMLGKFSTPSHTPALVPRSLTSLLGVSSVSWEETP